MEHRYHPRLEASIKVGVLKDDELLGYFETRNICLDGLFLDMDPCLLENNDVIGVLIGINGDAQMQKGIVVHTSPTGVGIMLIDVNKQVFKAIANLFKTRRRAFGNALGAIDPQLPSEIQDILPDVISHTDSNVSPGEQLNFQQAGKHRLLLQPRGIVVRTGKRFDISCTMLINRAIKAIQSITPKMVVIDLTDTEQLFDSGLALLMLLQQEAVELRKRIYIINGNQEIVDKLIDSSIAADLHIL